MKLLSIVIYAFIFVPSLGFSQTLIKRDVKITSMLEEVSASNLEITVRKLVSFKTRHTLSDTLSKSTGIGAARAWIKSTFEDYGKASNGRLKVSYDAFTQAADGKRVLVPTVLKNVIAVLPGSDPQDSRILMVCGHYDSRVTDVMNTKDFAPGANDDASGVAGVLELAR
jgi:hypothetical protein